MRSTVLGLDTRRRLEAMIVVLLSAFLMLELATFLWLNPDPARMVADSLLSLPSRSAAVMGEIGQYIWRMVGPMVLPLAVLLAIESIAVCSLYKYWKTGYWNWESKKIERHFRLLQDVEQVAPGFGFLGTCTSLVGTMSSMDPSLSQKEMLKTLLENSSSAFGSTICGISMAISAFVCLELFKGFLLSMQADSPPGVPVAEKGGETSSMRLVGKGG